MSFYVQYHDSEYYAKIFNKFINGFFKFDDINDRLTMY